MEKICYWNLILKNGFAKQVVDDKLKTLNKIGHCIRLKRSRQSEPKRDFAYTLILKEGVNY